MNKANILRVADAIEKGELVKRGIGFNMEEFISGAGIQSDPPTDHFRKCSTVACIAGWAYSISHPRRNIRSLAGTTTISEGAAHWLGLDDDTAMDLFVPTEIYDFATITPAHAVAVLRHLAETGEVDWSVGAP